ncbi:MAG: radical SAM protein [Bacteroidales bacterium]|nr:radical SAM protein [Bacteroidales bacterium]MDD4216606.1 radical SAM protein [Bacteroidales bacterium]MDY0141499.1 radical SAM protein [Bacteroidales bacterium]
MEILILNLPYKRKIIRKYSCSYHANGFLYPPLELVRVASIIKEKSPNCKLSYIDAIALNLSYKKCNAEILMLKPDIIITLTSIDFIGEERNYLKSLKTLIDAKLVVIGYIASMFPHKFSFADVVLGNNFESLINEACVPDKISVEAFVTSLKANKDKDYNFDPDIIQKVDLSFVDNNLYSELFAKGKTAFTYFSFGCPYKCTYCIRTYGLNKHYYRSTENILNEIEEYGKKGYKNIRLLDDNCNLNKDLLCKILDYQNKQGVEFNYFGLTRLDLLDEESLDLFGKLKFKNLLIGIETINEKTQIEYNKKLDLDFANINDKFSLLKKKGVEITVFILFNPLTETKLDLKKTLKFLSKLPINNAGLSFVNPYPGTELFKKNRNEIDFYFENEYKSQFNEKYYKNIKSVELWFMVSFYLSSPKRIFYLLKKSLLNPRQVFKIICGSFGYLFTKEKNNYF